ncbi:MAG: hypothetical protein LKI53_05890 [Bacteroidales bacterium]|nr:hypothetical protein [Bacteroidales bacterium]
MKNLLFIYLLFAVPALFGCGGNDDKNEINGLDEESAKEILQAHPWKISSFISEEDPYIIIFGENGVFESVNFSEWSHDEEWNIQNGHLVINGEYFDIAELTDSKLRLNFEESGTKKSFIFDKEDDKAGFPTYPLGKTYKVISGYFNGEDFTWEDNSAILRSKVLIENGSALITYSKKEDISWQAFSGSFAFSEDFDRGYEVEYRNDGDIILKWYISESNIPKSSISGTTVKEGEIILRECNVWDFICGPDWVLKEVDKNGISVTENIPVQIGTIWYFNVYTGKLEERAGGTSEDTEYMNWNFTEDPTEESVHIDIETEPGETITFALMRGNIAQLELKADIDSYTYTFKFEVEDE